MPKKIVLIEPKYCGFEFDYLPQGILSLAAYLREAGFDVSVHRTLPLPQADILGISATTLQYIEALNIARKSTAGMTIIGGAHVTTATGDAMASCAFDYGIIGDGEESFIDLCSGRPPKDIPGVVHHDGEVVMASPNRPFEYKSRAGGPSIPAYELLDSKIGKYVNVWRNREWDWQYKWKRKNRPKYWETFSKEIRLLADLGVSAIHVADENFGCWHSRIRSTVHALDRMDWWTCRSGVRNFLDKGLHRTLFASRCRGIELNIVTANKRLLNEFCDHTLEETELAIGLIEEIGLNLAITAVIGLPGETVDSMMDTWTWLRGRKVRLETLSPLPGTDFYEDPDRFGQFGFEVTVRELREMDVDKQYHLPWRMNTISHSEFVDIRCRMQKELG